MPVSEYSNSLESEVMEGVPEKPRLSVNCASDKALSGQIS